MRVDYEKALRVHEFDLAIESSQILGLIETVQREDHMWIENIAVLPEAQGRGIGRWLLAHAGWKAIKAGFAETRLVTNGAFEANLSLYRWLGYDIDREESFMNGIAVYMSKKLAR
jgi:GNAT superfamily N-acetyltransferase